MCVCGGGGLMGSRKISAEKEVISYKRISYMYILSTLK